MLALHLRTARFAGWLLICACIGAGACRGAGETTARRAPEPASKATRPNVVIFLTDTERPDRLSAYANPRRTSPFFERFAAQGFFFTSAYAPVSWTRPSVASLFTGTYPQRHGVQMRQDVLPSRLPTLAQVLGDAGYGTYILNTNPHVTDAWGMTRGFQHAVHLMPHPDQLKAGNGANTVLRHLRRLVPSLRPPFLLYVHLIDPHYPYAPPVADLEALGFRTKNPPSLARYDGELHYVDRHIETMTQVLDEAGLLESSIVVLTADHGDEFEEHGGRGHGSTLYQEVVRVPLAIGLSRDLRRRISGGDGPVTTCPRIETNVSLVDLMPTILDIAGVALPPQLDGQSLVPMLRCEATDETRPLYFSVEKEDVSLAAVLVGQSKLIVDRHSRRRRLYLLDENPRELTFNAARQRGAQELKDQLGTLLETFEWSVQPGVHIELAGPDGVDEPRRMGLLLHSSGTFTGLRTYTFEPGDRFEISGDGHTLKVDTTLTPFWHRSPKHVWVQDRDELRLEIEPPGAPLTISAELDGEAAPRRELRFPLGFPEMGARDWPVTLPRAELEAGAGLVDRLPAGIYVYEQRAPEKKDVEVVSREVHEALRALGYIQ